MRQLPLSVNPVPTDLLPPHLAGLLWRAQGRRNGAPDVLPTGHAALDEALAGGGWPCHSVSEVLHPSTGGQAWRLVAPALVRMVAQGGHVLLVAPPHTPFLPGLAQWGLPPERLVWVNCASAQQAWWVMEQALRSNAQMAVLGWSSDANPDPVRRLQVASGSHPGVCILFRPVKVADQASAAPVRIQIEPCAPLSRGPSGWAEPVSGVRVRVLKHRGPAPSAWLALHPFHPVPQALPGLHPAPALPLSTPVARAGASHALLDRLAHS